MSEKLLNGWNNSIFLKMVIAALIPILTGSIYVGSKFEKLESVSSQLERTAQKIDKIEIRLDNIGAESIPNSTTLLLQMSQDIAVVKNQLESYAEDGRLMTPEQVIRMMEARFDERYQLKKRDVK